MESCCLLRYLFLLLLSCLCRYLVQSSKSHDLTVPSQLHVAARILHLWTLSINLHLTSMCFSADMSLHWSELERVRIKPDLPKKQPSSCWNGRGEYFYALCHKNRTTFFRNHSWMSYDLLELNRDDPTHYDG